MNHSKRASAGTTALFVGILALKIILCFFTGHFDIYRFLVFIQHAITFPGADPWSYKAFNINSDFPYPPTLFLLLKSLVALGPVNPVPPHEPAAVLYSLVKIPILLADFIVAYIICARTNFRWMVATYWTSSVTIFHQYYSGQFDLLVSAPFLIGLHFSEPSDIGPNTMERPLSFYIGLLISVILKPFAFLFTPLYLATMARSPRKLLSAATGVLLILALFKISEWPHITSIYYREQMGAGANLLLMDVTQKQHYLFPIAYGLLVILVATGILKNRWKAFTIGALSIGAFAYHSAGWMTWAAVLLPIAIHGNSNRLSQLTWLVIWNVLFILRWAYCPTSPMFDSLSVLTDKFLGLSLNLPMGYLYHIQPTLFGSDSFIVFGTLFAIASIALASTIASNGTKSEKTVKAV